MTYALDDGFDYNRLAVPRSTRFLRKHDSEKMNMFVLFVDFRAYHLFLQFVVRGGRILSLGSDL